MFDDEFIRLPPFPRAAIRLVFAESTAAYNRLVADDTISEELLVSRLASVMGVKREKGITAIQVSLDFESLVTPMDVRRTLYRLAANYQRLRQGLACPRVRGHLSPCVGRATVIGVQGFLSSRKEPRLRYAYRVLEGPMAGEQVVASGSVASGSAVYRMLTGGPRHCAYQTPMQLVQLQLVLGLSGDFGDFKVEWSKVTKHQRSLNAKLARRRSRRHHACPFGMPKDCYYCPVGINECLRSVMPIETQLIKRANETAK